MFTFDVGDVFALLSFTLPGAVLAGFLVWNTARRLGQRITRWWKS